MLDLVNVLNSERMPCIQPTWFLGAPIFSAPLYWRLSPTAISRIAVSPSSLTTTAQEACLPLLAETVIVAFPFPTGETNPVSETDATAGLELIYEVISASSGYLATISIWNGASSVFKFFVVGLMTRRGLVDASPSPSTTVTTQSA